jgi:hypothetical protein
LYEDGRARAFFTDCTICELSQGAGVQVTDAGGCLHSLTCRLLVQFYYFASRALLKYLFCSNRGAFDWHIEQARPLSSHARLLSLTASQLLTFAEWASLDEESRAREGERRRQLFEATKWGVSSINNAPRLLAVRSATSV